MAVLATVITAEDADLLPRWSALINTVQAHFEMEDGWMRRTGFAANNCHSSQHAIILRILREGEARGHAGEFAVVRQMADELGQWLPQHVQSMDTSMVAHFVAVGFDPNTGAFTHNRPLTLQGIEGCGGGGSCAGDW